MKLRKSSLFVAGKKTSEFALTAFKPHHQRPSSTLSPLVPNPIVVFANQFMAIARTWNLMSKCLSEENGKKHTQELDAEAHCSRRWTSSR